MALSVKEQKTQAQQAAATWWQDKPFPQAAWGRPYLCDTCGSVITAREGTSLVEQHLECPTCTERLFPIGPPGPQTVAPPAAPPAPAGAQPVGQTAGPPTSPQPPPVQPAGPPPAPAQPAAPRTFGPYTPVTTPVVTPTPPWTPTASWTPSTALPPVQQPQAAPPPQKPPRAPLSPAARRRRRTLMYIGVAVVAVLGLVVGLLVWAPWVKPLPKVPTNVRGLSTTASSINIAWTAAEGGPKPDRYYVMRNGKEVATLSATQTTYIDKDLRPGVSYKYSVAAETGSRRSAATAEVTASTTTPSPVGLTAGAATTSTLTIVWSAPPDSPAPDEYVVMREGATIREVPGNTTSFQDSGLTPGTSYSYQVSAMWGNATSDPTAELKMSTALPALSTARLSGDFTVNVKVTAVGGGNVKVGTTWSNDWTFTPTCASGACTVKVTGEVAPSGFTSHSFTATLGRMPNGVYSGAIHAHITHCGEKPTVVDVTNTVNVRLQVKSGFMDGTTWAVDTWTGTLRIDSPYTSAGSYYCPAQSMSTALSAS